MKRCSKCKTMKDESEFTKDSSKKDNLASHCRECKNEKDRKYYKTHKQKLDRAYYQKNKRKLKDIQLKNKYGISIEEYEQLHTKQNGLCCICKKPETSVINKNGSQSQLSVDHDHKTGKIRGLLCGNCNRALGLFNDNISSLLKAAIYLLNTK